MYGEHDIDAPRRVAAGAATVAVHVLLAAILIRGLAFAPQPADTPELALTTLDFSPPPEPLPPPPPPEAREAAAPEPPAPAGETGEALPKEAPQAAIPLSPTPAAATAGSGRDASQGSGTAGAGQGAGGTGTGTGGGGQGGTGSPARKIAGQLRDRDYPREAEAQRLAGTVGIRFRVRTDGRIDNCSIAQSSGHAMLDTLTCRLVTERFRFQPATDAAGVAIESTLGTSFTWGTRAR